MTVNVLKLTLLLSAKDGRLVEGSRSSHHSPSHLKSIMLDIHMRLSRFAGLVVTGSCFSSSLVFPLQPLSLCSIRLRKLAIPRLHA